MDDDENYEGMSYREGDLLKDLPYFNKDIINIKVRQYSKGLVEMTFEFPEEMFKELEKIAKNHRISLEEMLKRIVSTYRSEDEEL